MEGYLRLFKKQKAWWRSIW